LSAKYLIILILYLPLLLYRAKSYLFTTATRSRYFKTNSKSRLGFSASTHPSLSSPTAKLSFLV